VTGLRDQVVRERDMRLNLNGWRASLEGELDGQDLYDLYEKVLIVL
jgi:hypothetical protein